MLDSKFWLAVSFFTFLYFAYKPIKKALIKYLDNEINDVTTSLSEAQKLKEEALDISLSLKLAIKNLEKERLSLVKLVQEQNDLLVEEHKKEMNLIMNQKKKEAMDKIEQLTLDSRNEIRNMLLSEVELLTKNYILKNRQLFGSDSEIASNLIANKLKNI